MNRKNKDEKKNNFVGLRFNDKDYQTILLRSKKIGVNLSEYLRRSALEKEIISFDEDRQILAQLRKVGNNLNQLTMLSHQGKIKVVDLKLVNELLIDIKRDMIQLRK